MLNNWYLWYFGFRMNRLPNKKKPTNAIHFFDKFSVLSFSQHYLYKVFTCCFITTLTIGKYLISHEVSFAVLWQSLAFQRKAVFVTLWYLRSGCNNCNNCWTKTSCRNVSLLGLFYCLLQLTALIFFSRFSICLLWRFFGLRGFFWQFGLDLVLTPASSTGYREME